MACCSTSGSLVGCTCQLSEVNRPSYTPSGRWTSRSLEIGTFSSCDKTGVSSFRTSVHLCAAVGTEIVFVVRPLAAV